jgi:hypothetical protein
VQRANRDSHKPEHFDVKCSEHAPYLPVLAFVEDDLKPAIFLSRAQHA